MPAPYAFYVLRLKLESAQLGHSDHDLTLNKQMRATKSPLCWLHRSRNLKFTLNVGCKPGPDNLIHARRGRLEIHFNRKIA